MSAEAIKVLVNNAIFKELHPEAKVFKSVEQILADTAADFNDPLNEAVANVQAAIHSEFENEIILADDVRSLGPPRDAQGIQPIKEDIPDEPARNTSGVAIDNAPSRRTIDNFLKNSLEGDKAHKQRRIMKGPSILSLQDASTELLIEPNYNVSVPGGPIGGFVAGFAVGTGIVYAEGGPSTFSRNTFLRAVKSGGAFGIAGAIAAGCAPASAPESQMNMLRRQPGFIGFGIMDDHSFVFDSNADHRSLVVLDKAGLTEQKRIPFEPTDIVTLELFLPAGTTDSWLVEIQKVGFPLTEENMNHARKTIQEILTTYRDAERHVVLSRKGRDYRYDPVKNKFLSIEDDHNRERFVVVDSLLDEKRQRMETKVVAPTAIKLINGDVTVDSLVSNPGIVASLIKVSVAEAAGNGIDRVPTATATTTLTATPSPAPQSPSEPTQAPPEPSPTIDSQKILEDARLALEASASPVQKLILLEVVRLGGGYKSYRVNNIDYIALYKKSPNGSEMIVALYNPLAKKSFIGRDVLQAEINTWRIIQTAPSGKGLDAFGAPTGSTIGYRPIEQSVTNPANQVLNTQGMEVVALNDGKVVWPVPPTLPSKEVVQGFTAEILLDRTTDSKIINRALQYGLNGVYNLQLSDGSYVQGSEAQKKAIEYVQQMFQEYGQRPDGGAGKQLIVILSDKPLDKVLYQTEYHQYFAEQVGNTITVMVSLTPKFSLDNVYANQEVHAALNGRAIVNFLNGVHENILSKASSFKSEPKELERIVYPSKLTLYVR